MEKTIKYTSPNGYTGILYGESSFSIRDCNNHEVMHTGFRNFDSYNKLVEAVENFPKLMEALGRIDVLNDSDDEDDI